MVVSLYVVLTVPFIAGACSTVKNSSSLAGVPLSQPFSSSFAHSPLSIPAHGQGPSVTSHKGVGGRARNSSGALCVVLCLSLSIQYVRT